MAGKQTKGSYIVTGARTGIGRAITKRLLSEGFGVVGLSRKISGDEFSSDQFTPLACDLSQLDTIRSVFKQAVKQTDRLEGAIFCAGEGLFGSLEQLAPDAIRALIDLNLTSQILAAQVLVPELKRKGVGHLVFIGSEAALQGGQKGAIYCATKFGLRGFTQALREESATAGLRVSLINPGMVDTPFFDDLEFRPGREKENSISPETVADATYWVISTPQETQIDEINLSPGKKVIQFK